MQKSEYKLKAKIVSNNKLSTLCWCNKTIALLDKINVVHLLDIMFLTGFVLLLIFSIKFICNKGKLNKKKNNNNIK